MESFLKLGIILSRKPNYSVVVSWKYAQTPSSYAQPPGDFPSKPGRNAPSPRNYAAKNGSLPVT